MKKTKSITILSLITALTLTACGSKFSFEEEMGALSANMTNMGVHASIHGEFIYYQGTDGFYEYDPQDKTSARVSETDLGFNAVEDGFIVGENGNIRYLNHKGEVLSRQSFSECDDLYHTFAYDNCIYCGDYVFYTDSGKTTRLFEERDTSNGYYYALSEDYYYRVVIGEKLLEKISVKDKNYEVQAMKLPEEIKWVSEFAVDLNSDIYISSSDGDFNFTLYKIAAGSDKAIPVDIVGQTIHYTVLNGNIAYIESYKDKASNNLYYNDKLIVENVFRFTLLSEKYLIFSVTDKSQIEYVYLYDIERGSTEQLKTVTEE